MGSCVALMALFFLLNPSRGSQTERLLLGGIYIFAGLAFFLYYVIETWQTRRLVRMRGGPRVNYETQRVWYFICLLLLGAMSAFFWFLGVQQILLAIHH